MDSGWGGHFVNSVKLVVSLFVRRFVFGWYGVERRLAAIEAKIDSKGKGVYRLPPKGKRGKNGKVDLEITIVEFESTKGNSHSR